MTKRGRGRKWSKEGERLKLQTFKISRKSRDKGGVKGNEKALFGIEIMVQWFLCIAQRRPQMCLSPPPALR